MSAPASAVEALDRPVSAARHAARPRRRLRVRLTDSPISRIGFWWATLVGFAWGLTWSTGRVELRHGLLVFTGMPKWTFGRGGSCVGACYLTDRNDGEKVLGHEVVHKRQWQRYGMLFPLLYLLAGRDPLRNRFEIEAGLEAGGYVRADGSPRHPARPSRRRRG
ncbi:Fe-S oxidoreductase [Agromyces sp. MMS24-JH15]|uniref:Fe-S oxidoreductase n=1 Tax=Agromyces sp. MMS24-JH15 TaxID=3243765 RepID=UPI00374A121F